MIIVAFVIAATTLTVMWLLLAHFLPDVSSRSKKSLLHLQTGLLAVIVAFTFSYPSVSAATHPKVGKECSKIGQTEVHKGKMFKCVKKGKKVVWKRVKTAQVPRPAVTQSAPATSDRSTFSPALGCKLGSPWPDESENAGFPRGANFAPALGDRKSLVIFVEFPDVPRDERQIQEWKNHQIPAAEKAYGVMSYGKYNLRYEYKEKFFRLNDPSLYYYKNYAKLIQDAVAQAQKEIDISRYDFVNVVTPNTDNIPDEGAAGWAGGIGTMGPIGEYLDNPSKRNWLMHETGHVLGLMHGYDYRGASLGAWDVMANSFGLSDDLLGWNKFKLGWVADTEIDCLGDGVSRETVHRLGPIGAAGENTKLVVVKLNETEALGIELRRKTDIDYLTAEAEGVLVYKIDTKIPSGEGAFQIVSNPTKFSTGTNGNRVLLGTMKLNEEVDFAGVKVKVIHEDSDSAYVSLSSSV